MKKSYLVIPVLVCVVFLLLHCHEKYLPNNTDYVEPPSPVRYLSFTHYPWDSEVPELEKTAAHGFQFKNFSYHDDTLTLRMQLYAQVNVHFIDSVAIKDNCLTLMLGDTASMRARYFTRSFGDFKFIYPYGKSAVRLILKTWDYPNDTFKTPLDTIIQVY